MTTRLIQQFVQSTAWEQVVEVLAALPGNY